MLNILNMTASEENYLKVIYHLTFTSKEGVSTNAIAQKMQTKASSVTDMLKKLSDKKWVIYQKYQGVSLTNEGLFAALEKGIFGGVKRHRNGGKGLSGVVKKAEQYYNPFIERMISRK